MPSSRFGRDLLLTFLSVPALIAIAFLGADDAAWFPQHWSEEFYVTKGVVGVLAVSLILFHMSQAWSRVTTAGQRLRYLALLTVTVLIASASSAQISEGVPVSGRNVGGMFAVLLVIVAMVVSIRQDRRD